MLFSRISEHSKGCLILILDDASKNFGKNTFHLFSSFCYNLVYPLLCNIVYFIARVFYHTLCDFCWLVNSVSTCVSEVIAVQESSYLFFCSLINFFCLLLTFVCVVACLNSKCSGSATNNFKKELFFYFDGKFARFIQYFHPQGFLITPEFIDFVLSKF